MIPDYPAGTNIITRTVLRGRKGQRQRKAMRPWAQRQSQEEGILLALKVEGPRAKVCGQPVEA